MSVISDRRICEYLDRWSMAHANKGWSYLMAGIRLLLDEKVDRSSTMELYEAIGQKCKTQGYLVERCIRDTIKASKARGMPNREFFARAVDALIYSDDESAQDIMKT